MKHTRLLLAALLTHLSLPLLAASTDTWVGGSGNNFSTTANWTYSSGSGPVASGDTFSFTGAGSTTPNNDESGFTFGGISFSGTTAYTLGGNDFTLGSGASIINAGAVNQTINNNIALSGSGGILNPSVASAALTLGGIISGSANLTKSGNSGSTLTLTGVNTFSGVLTFNAGTVVFTTPPSVSGGNLGNPSGITFGGSSTTTLVTSSGAGSVTISSPTITANASSTALFKNGAAAGSIYEIATKITGVGNCKQNTPTTTGAIVRFSNDGNDYTGAFTMAAGIVEFSSIADGGTAAALGGKGSGNYAVVNSTSGATLRYVGSGTSSSSRNIDWQGTSGALTLDCGPTASGPVVSFLGSGNLRSGSGVATLTLTGSSTGANTLAQTINDGAVTGTTTLSKAGSGTWVLSGANGYSAGTSISAGTLRLSGSGTLGSAAAALTITGGTLDLGGSSQSQGVVAISGTSAISNGTLTGSSFSATPTSGNTVSISANLAGSSALFSDTGVGTVALTGTSSCNGGMIVGGGGVLSYNSIAPGGSSSALGYNSVLNLKSGAFQYTGPTATNSRSFVFSTLTGTPVWNVENAGTNTTLTLTADFVGGTNGGAAGARTIGLNVTSASESGPSGTLKMSGVIPDATPTNSTTVVAGGTTGFTVFNGGTVSLLSVSNTFSGAIQVKYARTLQVMSLADLNVPCSIGLGTTPPAGTAPIIIGSTDSQRGGTLAYLGTNDASCNRQICVEGVNFGGQSGATILNNSPTDSALHFSSTQPAIYFSGVLISNCLFTLGGSAAAVNVFDLPITNTPLGSAALTVSGSAWRVTAAHSYAGATTVSGGTLLLDGSIAGSGVKVTSGTLGGSGSISSAVTVQSGGTLQPGGGGSDIKTLTIGSTLSLAGKTVMLLNRTNTQTASLVTGLSTVTNGGTLTITNVGDALQAGDTFTLFAASSYVGTFAATNLPALAGNLAWDLTKLYVNGTISVEQAPIAGNLTATVTQNQPLVLSTAKLLALCSDPDSDTLTVISAGPTSTNGGAAVLSGANVTYTPVTDFTGTDLFTYTISDGRGGSATGNVTVTVTSSNAPSLNIVSGPSILPDGHFHVGFAGIPGYSYTIQYSENAGGPWTTLTNLTAGTEGQFDFEDPTDPAPPSRYYRTTYP